MAPLTNFLPLVALLYLTSLISTATADFASDCLAFSALDHLPALNTTLSSTTPPPTLLLQQHHPANTTLILPNPPETCNRPNTTLPIASCRLTLNVPTSNNNSSFIMELFLPSPDIWLNSSSSSRLLATGNGGIDGCLKYEDISYGLSHNFAAFGTNNGHNGTIGNAFLNNPDVIIDFSYRSLHTATLIAKSLVTGFYGQEATRSYYFGCSGGGRQGVQAADMFPEDYDGVLVGAPALNFNYMSMWRGNFYVDTGANTSEGFIGKGTWEGLVHEEVLRQCDLLDGAADGIVEDPGECVGVFRAEALLCGANATQESNGNTTCLTVQQVDVVKKVFSPLYGIKGQLIYPPLCPGAELLATQRLLAGLPFPYSVDWFRYAVYNDSSWEPTNLTIADADVADEINPGNARTWPDDLSTFRDRGSKMLIYQGGMDQQITMLNTQRWYDYLSRGMDVTSDEMDGFLRFFKIPGMGHCGDGVGAWMIGQSQAGEGVEGFEPETNVLAALVQWVEQGEGPETVTGVKYVDDEVDKGVGLRRRHCRYPLRSLYVGGDAKTEEAWSCE